jgi:hypothetical protein
MLDAMIQGRRLAPTLRDKNWVVAIAVTAVVFRLIIVLQPGFNQPDEIWQYIEPAWGWLTGRWVQTWEFHVGLRGWLMPMLFRPVLAAGIALDLGGQGTLILLRLIIALVALVVPYTFWRLGAAISPLHALIAGWVGAIWPEIFYFAARPSGENLATIAAFAAILAIYHRPPADTPQTVGRDRARLVWIGLCLGLGVIIRFQYAPALGLLGLGALRGAAGRRMPWLLLGALTGCALGAAADLAAGQPPLGWLLTNFTMNFSENRSGFFGKSPPWWYLQQIGLTWSLGTLLFVPGILLAARRYPLLLAVAVVTLVSHSLIPHKEYRFILLAQVLFIFMAAVGSLDLALAVMPRRPLRTLGILAGIWFAAAVLTSATTPFVDNWGNGRAVAKSLALAGADPGLCGMATYQVPSHPMMSYALLGRDVPILLIDGPQASTIAADNAARFNMIFAPRAVEHDLPAAYSLVACQFPSKKPKDQYYCIFKRAGSCHGGAGDLDYNRAITRLGA